MIDGADAESATKLLPYLASFSAVMETGSYSAAARRLGVDKTLVSRRVKSLERGLGVRLLHRTTRSISPTEAGQRLYDQIRAPLGDTITAVLAAGSAQRIEGTVRVATFSFVGAELWGPVVATLRERHPRLHLDLRSGDPFIDLVDHGIDLALRSGHMPSSSLIARRIGTWRFVLCAAPEWLERNGGDIHHPEDTQDQWLLYGGVPRAHQWQFARGDHRHELRVRALATVDSSELQHQLVLAGAGIAALPAVSARHHLASGRLVRVLPDWHIDHAHGLWIVLPSRAYTPPRVDVVITAVTERASALQPTWDEAASPRPT